VTHPEPTSGGRELYKLLVPALILILLAFWFTYPFVDPAPPRRITMATGALEGAYHSYGEAYRYLLARDGIGVDVKTTAGSVENLELLTSKGIHLMNMDRVQAYVVNFHYLSKLTIPEGAIDLVRNLPATTS
jgi:TRAP-type uncharacterized transport system substrate-binding protein